MPTWIEPPPKERKSGCLGKGCLMLVVFLILLATIIPVTIAQRLTHESGILSNE